jgi:hypothetical protein
MHRKQIELKTFNETVMAYLLSQHFYGGNEGRQGIL